MESERPMKKRKIRPKLLPLTEHHQKLLEFIKSKPYVLWSSASLRMKMNEELETDYSTDEIIEFVRLLDIHGLITYNSRTKSIWVGQ